MYESEETKVTGEVPERDKGALIFGTVLSVPLFLFCYFVVAVVSYVAYTFFLSVQGGEVSRLVELAGSVISSIAGAAAGRWACDKAFRDWSGWAVFVAMILLGLATAYAIFQGYSDGVWSAVLQFTQVAAAIAATWYFAVKKADIS
jgi:hypothetical protein